MNPLLQDIRYGIRVLTKHRGFTAAALLTLALGIGANTAIFSLIDGVLLKPLPFEDPDRLVAVWEANVERGGLMAVAPPNYQDWRDQNTVFEDVVGFYTVDFTLVGEGVPERLEGARVSSGTFELLGVDSIATPRFSALLLGSFAVGALLLSAVGIYGVISFSVRRRIREIGIRVAMGAEPGDIFKLVIARGMGLAGIGVGIGLAGVLALTRFLSSQLFGVGSADPVTLGGITGLLLLTAFLACYLPARRATEIDPLTALHLE